MRQASSTQDQDGVADDDTTHQSGTYGFQLSWEIDLFGRLRRQHEAALALVLASEQGRRGVLVTLVGDVATNYFLLRELDLQLEIARRDAAPQRRDGHLLPEPAGRRRVEPARARSHPGAPCARPPPRFPIIEQQIAIVENALSLLLGRPPAPVDRASASPTPSCCRRRFRPGCRRR